jgi:hypothetical protein
MNPEPKNKLRYRLADALASTVGILFAVLLGIFLFGFLARFVFAWLHLGWRFGQWLGL